MSALRKLLRVPRREVRLLTEAGALVLAVRLGVALLPFRAVRRLAVREARHPAHAEHAAAPRERTIWAVRSVAQRVPGATCLVQALGARAAEPTRLSRAPRLGARRGDAPVEQFSRLPLRSL